MDITSTLTQPQQWASARVRAMPKSIFAEMDAAKTAAKAKGLDVIDLSIGSSDLSPPAAALTALHEATDDPTTYGYCLASGTAPLREAVAGWYNQRFNPPAKVDADDHVLPLIGSQEGLANLLFAVTDPGDVILVPNPAYPSYFGAVALAGLTAISMPLLADNGFLPVLADIPSHIADKARVLLISYPNNPTAATAPVSFFKEAISFCKQHNILLVHDFPYVDMTFGDYRAPSLFELAGGLDVGIELYSCSKSFHMGGFRMGWAIGNSSAISALAQAKSAIDFNQYAGIQRAAIAALQVDASIIHEATQHFELRRNTLVNALATKGWQVPLPAASMYIWAPLPDGQDDAFSFAKSLAAETGVCLSPGDAFGSYGKGYVRFALVRDCDVLEDVAARIANFLAA
ncbi:MAG: LL-diaminopimelate aminotransferase [Deinococcota bacterium]